MSLYREAKSGRGRLWMAVGAAVLVVVLVAGVVLAQDGEPTPGERLEKLQEDVQPALAALELVPLNYRSQDATTRAAAAEQLEVARETVADVEPELGKLDRAATTRLLSGLAELERLMSTPGRGAAVERTAATANAELRRLVGLD